MKYRHVTLLALTGAFTSDVTYTIDLDMADPISEIYMDIRATNGPIPAWTGAPIQTVTKVEIVDGSDVLYSLDGLEAEALDIYHSGQYPRGQRNTYEALQENTRVVGISFGRWLWDDLLAFDPKHFSNPQLKISFDINGGGMTPTAAKLKVCAALFDEKVISPVGFLMSKELKTWTMAAAHVYTDMPLDYPYRKLFIQSRKNDSPPNWNIAHVKLSTDQDKKVIIDHELLELVSGMCRENSMVSENIVVMGSAAATHFYVTPTMNVVIAGALYGSEAGTNRSATFDGGDGGYVGYQTEVAWAQNVKASGQCPHGTLCIPFGDQKIIEDWFDLSGIGNLKLDVTDGVSAGTTKVFIQQLRTY